MSPRERYFRLIDEVASISARSGRINDKITVIAVSKGHSWDQIGAVADAGCRDFGENRILEALTKFPPNNDLNLHMIGTLQTNKLKKVIESCSLIHSVDSLKIAKKISEFSQELAKETKILLQVNSSGELSKHGFSPEELKTSFEEIIHLKNMKIEGLMTMAPFTEEESVIRQCFSRLRHLKDDLNQSFSLQMPHLSMGMSNDYLIAIQEGATLLRIGSAIFGNTPLSNKK